MNIFNRLKTFQIPWSILIALVLFFPGAFCVVSSDAAMAPSEAILKGYKPMPSEWEAGVFNHGEYIQWYLPEKHPILYITSWFILLSSYLFWINALIKVRNELNEYKREQELRKISKE
jgi:hypothetical protein